MLTGLLAAREMAEHIANIHAQRLRHLTENAPEVEEVYTAADLQRACASVAAGLATAMKSRADIESTTEYERAEQGWRRVELAPPRPWWRRLLGRWYRPGP